MFLFVCLFVCPTREFDTHMEISTLSVKGYIYWPILIAIEQWGFFNVPHHCDTGQPFNILISEDPWHSHLSFSVLQRSCQILFQRPRFVPTGDRTTISRMRGERSTSTAQRVFYVNELQHTQLLVLILCYWCLDTSVEGFWFDIPRPTRQLSH